MVFSAALNPNTISVEKLPSDYPEIFVAGIFLGYRLGAI
jgi:hypothetical protein